MFKPELGVSLHCISPRVTKDLLQALADCSVKTLELYPTLFEDPDGAAAQGNLKSWLTRHYVKPMTVHALFGGTRDLSSSDPQTRNNAVSELRTTIDLALEFQAHMVVIHPSWEPIAPDHRTNHLACLRRSLEEITPYCHKTRCRVAVELLPRTCLGNTVTELLEIITPLDQEIFGACLDTNHLMADYASLASVVRTLGKRLFTLHISDYDGIDEKHWLPGQGVIDWPNFMAALDEIDYQGPFNYECKFYAGSPAARLRLLEANLQWLCQFAPHS